MNARVKNLPGTTPLVAMALIDMAVSKVCVEGKGTDFNGNKTKTSFLAMSVFLDPSLCPDPHLRLIGSFLG